MVASLSPGKRKKSPSNPVFSREKGKEERKKKKKGMFRDKIFKRDSWEKG